ncbi:hypothetical protein [Pseudomonas phoenicis]|uniref:hypothetical protein n=1 Tax=unclassified Pseudomonas TaxID=196821 RepID=UPI0039A1E43E
MVTHYSTNGLQAACGRTAQTLVSTGVSEQVSCKSCQRTLLKPAATSVARSPSLAELRKQAKAAATPAAPSASTSTSTPPRHSPVSGEALVRVTPVQAETPQATAMPTERTASFSVKAAWAAKLTAQGHRAPRGKLRKTRG